MSATALAARPDAQADLSVRCTLCSAEAPEPADSDLRHAVRLSFHWDDAPYEIVYGRDANGWLAVSNHEHALLYCPAHKTRQCLRHAAASLGVDVEGLR